jgi:hypothetical protein
VNIEDVNPRLGEIVKLRIEDVHPDPNNPRDEMTHIPELAALIKMFGQLEPIIVRPYGDVHMLVQGERRWTAMKSLGLEYIDARVGTTTEEISLLLEIAGNAHEPLTADEKSRGIQQALFFDNPPNVETLAAVAMVSVEDMEKIARGSRSTGDQALCECYPLEWSKALDELADDPEGYEAVKNAKPTDWHRVHDGIKRAARTRVIVAEAEAIVREAGCELIATPGSEHRFIRNSHMSTHIQPPVAPEGAKYGRVTAYSDTYVDITWYGDRGDDEEPDSEREEKEKAAAQVEASHIRRLEFIGRHLQHTYGTDALTAYAYEAWRDRGLKCEAKRIPEAWAIKGQTMFFLAAVLAAAEENAHDTARGLWNRDQAETDRYLAAMKAVGYEEAKHE